VVESILERGPVLRVRAALRRASLDDTVRVLDSSARTAQEAADSLGVEVGQIASSIVFRLPDDRPLLVITSGRHRVDPQLVARALGLGELGRADADFVKGWSGFSIGGVSPVGWDGEMIRRSQLPESQAEVVVVIDEALADYDVIWAAAGHPHAVFASTFDQLRVASGARALTVAHA
jgi:prolyl-tRNA editing enzyme YbaK/EbsC (Cys-tRNA(Pro) deacylase)